MTVVTYVAVGFLSLYSFFFFFLEMKVRHETVYPVSHRKPKRLV